MKLLGRSVTIIILFFLCRAFFACCVCYDSVAQYRFTSVELSNLDNSGPTAVITDRDTINKNAFGIQLAFGVRYALNENTPADIFTTATAGSNTCRGCEGIVKWSFINSIEEIKVTTLGNFDATHPAGADITEYFKILNGDLYIDIDEYTQRRYSPAFDETHPKPQIGLYLLKTISSNEPQSFRVNLRFLSDTLRLSQTTHPVILN